MDHISLQKEKSLKAISQKVKRYLKKHKDLEKKLSNSTFCLKKDLTSNEGRKFSVFERTPASPSTSDIDTKDSHSTKSIKRKFSEDSDSDVNKTPKTAKVLATVKDAVASSVTNEPVTNQLSTSTDKAKGEVIVEPIETDLLVIPPKTITKLTKSQKKKN